MNKTNNNKGNNCKLPIVVIVILHLCITMFVNDLLLPNAADRLPKLSDKLMRNMRVLRSDNDNPQKINLKTDIVITVWQFEAIKIISICLQPPTGAILGPFWQHIHRAYIEQPFNLKKISEQNKILRLYVIDNMQYGINSLSLGLLIYGIMSLCRYLNKEQKG